MGPLLERFGNCLGLRETDGQMGTELGEQNIHEFQKMEPMGGSDWVSRKPLRMRELDVGSFHHFRRCLGSPRSRGPQGRGGFHTWWTIYF